MLTRFLRRRAIRSYLRQLLYLLRSDHGIETGESYTAGQIVDTLTRHGLSVRFEYYAIAMFVSEEAYEAARQQRGWAGDYNSLRKEIASMIAANRAQVHPTAAFSTYTGSNGTSAHECQGHHGHDCGHGGG
ncbi:hypothetical protein PQQ96_16140 [Paraburkholderia sediminicola]|uniref:DUF6559 family protein n=1 Tax=Paraburkholderia sediminicola TaxID=458836 RepID=UPI0038BA0AAB